jgi:hypothetical protein
LTRAPISTTYEWFDGLDREQVKAVIEFAARSLDKPPVWARQLADLSGGRTVQWSDSWTDDDLAEATAAAVRRFEDREREESQRPSNLR